MLAEHDQKGRVSLWRFYARRGLRILPVYFAYLAVLAALQAWTPFRQSSAAWIGNLTFTTNFILPNPTCFHLWSLAVEEQFYLVWPGIFVIFGVAKNLRISIFLLALPVCVAPLARVISYLHASPSILHPFFTPFSCFTVFDSLAIGCACAILFVRRGDAVRRLTTIRPRFFVLVAATLVLLPHILNRTLVCAAFTVPLGNSSQGIGLAMILLQGLISPGFGFYAILNNPIVCHIGVLSYSIYVWQQVFWSLPQVSSVGATWWMAFPGWLVAAFTAALISYHFLEQPLFRLRSLLRET